MTEQRNYHRIKFRTEADISINEQIFRCDLVDLALQGALFRSEQQLPLAPGNQAQLSIYLPDTSVRMSFTGELVHHSGNVYGFAFVAEDSESLGHLRRLLELNFGNADLADREFAYWLQQGSGK